MHGWRIDRAIHNYIYFTQYDRYVKTFLESGRETVDKHGKRWTTRLLFKAFYNRYHAKVITRENAVKIFSLNQNIDISPHVAEKVIPMPYAKKIILEEPQYIAVMDCPCRVHREKHCEPVNVCIAVGKTTAHFWLEHCEKYNVRKISQEEALKIITQSRERGEITTAWFKVATGGRTGVICNCCSCCCGGLEGMRLSRKIEGGETLSNIVPSGYKISHIESECKACGQCIEVCVFDAITRDEAGRPVFNRDACFGCGICVEKCPEKAIKMSGEFEELYPLDLDLLKEKSAEPHALKKTTE